MIDYLRSNIELDQHEISLLRGLIEGRCAKLKQWRSETDADFAFRVEAYAQLARKFTEERLCAVGSAPSQGSETQS